MGDLSTSCALAIALVHRFEFSPRIRCSGSEVEKIVSLECIGTLELVTLGTWSP